MKKLFIFALALVMLVFTTSMAVALESSVDSCLIQDRSRPIYLGFDNSSQPEELLTYVRSNCTNTELEWVDPVNVSILGDVQPGEVVVTDTFVFVDTFLRPDLDLPAVLRFNNPPFAVQPDVLRNGDACMDCNISWDQDNRLLEVGVPGFSNYSLTAAQDFTVYSDPEPELDDRVYQTIDIGDRSTEYKCVVQIYGQNENSEFVLLQTNPERNVAAKMWGSPDANNPESLGYFKTENGIANVYFNGEKLVGYTSLQYVAQCVSNSTKLVYEEPIDTRYSKPGQGMVARGIWFAEDANGVYIVAAVIVVMILLWIVAMYLRSVWKIFRGY